MDQFSILNLAILDDHQIIIDGLKLLLQNKKEFNVVYDCTKGNDLIHYLSTTQHTVDILIMDLIMPEMDGYEMALLLKEQYPALRIIILSMSTQYDMIYQLIEKTDIKGYLPKSVNKDVLFDAIHTIYNGHLYIHSDILEELEHHKVKIFEKEKLMLSPREVEIVQLISKGLGNKEIASALYLSEHTVATHRKNIFRKTDTHNAAALVELSAKLGII